MEYVAILIIVSIMISMFLPWSKWLDTDFEGTYSYDDGYELAVECIQNGDDPQELYNACYYSITEFDKWDKGWIQACIDHGARKLEL